MEFRWVAIIALWTILSGPIFNGRGISSPTTREKVAVNVIKSNAAPNIAKLPHRN